MFRNKFALPLVAAAALAAATAVTGPGGEAKADIDLPKQITWTAYGTGSAGYNQSVAVGAALQDALGVNLRILPGKNDISRTEPLRQGKAEFSAAGAAFYLAQEGVFDFGAENWGPIAVRQIIANNAGGYNIALGVAGDAGVKKYSDLKGKRVAKFAGAPALNVNTEAYLAYGGLTWDDVEAVEFGGFAAGWKGLVEGSVDAAFATTNSGRAYEAEAGPRGLFWPPVDPKNKKGIERMNAVVPWYTLNKATVGATVDPEKGHQGATYSYPVLITMEETSDDLAYNMTKAMVELFDDYDGKAPGISGWAIDRQNFTWVAPFHDGAVKYYKEIGVWSSKAQKHNDNLVARQKALAKAWKELKAQKPSNWEDAWAKKRRKALADGGFAVFF